MINKQPGPGGISLPTGLYSIKEAAFLTGVSESTLRRLDNSGKLKAKRVRFGKRNYRVYDGDDIITLKDKKTRKILTLQRQLMRLYGKKYNFGSDCIINVEYHWKQKKLEAVEVTFNYNG